MSQIDARIALGFQPQTQIQDPTNALAKMLQVQGAQQEGQMRAMQMQDAQEARTSKNKLAELYQSSMGADGKIDRNKLYQGAAQGGLGAQIPGLQKQFADVDEQAGKIGKTTAETEKLQIASQREKLSLVGQLLNGVRDQATYDQARATAQQNGLDVSAMPPQYDPAVVSQKLQQALTVEEQLAQVWKQKGYDLDVRQQGEVERNNKTQNAISRGNLGVAQANLGLSRERLALERSAPKGQFLETQDGFVLGDPRTGTTQPVLGPNGQQMRGKTGDKPLTEGQAKAVAFASRMENSEKVIGDLASKGVNASVPGSRLPLVGDVISAAQPAERQMLDQAKRDFINSVLRRESGAVISDSEFSNAERQYFPQVGDSKQVIEQKKRNRRVSIDGMRADVPQASQSKVDEISGGGSGAPKSGEVVDGYRFKGGNPADAKNWEKN